jgi:hypothetical protein
MSTIPENHGMCNQENIEELCVDVDVQPGRHSLPSIQGLRSYTSFGSKWTVRIQLSRTHPHPLSSKSQTQLKRGI